MRQAALTLGSAPDCGTFIYTLKVPHTHPPMPKSKGLTRPGFAMQLYIVIVSFKILHNKSKGPCIRHLRVKICGSNTSKLRSKIYLYRSSMNCVFICFL